MRQERQQSTAEENELDELELENVTSDIKEWLTSTFATKQQVYCHIVPLSHLSHRSDSQQEYLWKSQV